MSSGNELASIKPSERFIGAIPILKMDVIIVLC